jgi:hypothetical protein
VDVATTRLSGSSAERRPVPVPVPHARRLDPTAVRRLSPLERELIVTLERRGAVARALARRVLRTSCER